MKNILYLLAMLPFASIAQITIPAGIDVKANSETDIAIQTPGTITNANAFDFSGVNLILEFTGASQGIVGNFVVRELVLNGDGVKNQNGNITITDKLTFTKGILKPVSADHKILFTGDEGGITGGDDNSYYDGVFYNDGSGKRLFPVGYDLTYAPISFEKISAETGVKVIGVNPQLSFDAKDIIGVNEDRYWEIVTDPAKVNSRASVSLNKLDAFVNGTEGGETVVQASAVETQAINLGINTSASSEILVSSQKDVTMPILAVGKENKITLEISDLITPAGSVGSNDRLYIKHLDRFERNIVTLLDRWGVEIAKWTNYTNEASSFDFNKLSAGNYICIVEYGNGEEANKVAQQMITVLKIN